MLLVHDTSALLSLEMGKVLEKVIEDFQCAITPKVLTELQGIAKNKSCERNLAKNVLKYVEMGLTVYQASKEFDDAELECAYVAEENQDIAFIICDDIRAIEKMEKITKKPIVFSPLPVLGLCINRRISFQEGFKIVERMAVNRNWKDNVIFSQAKELWEKQR